jgi:PAS domain S-box-containing protein
MRAMAKFFDIHSLPMQMIAAFIAIVLLTAATVGLPAVWLLQNQLDRQAWSQVAQGHHAAMTLYDIQMRELESLATLTAQRPTLQLLLDQSDQAALTDYLVTLQTSVSVDLIMVCSSNRLVAATISYLSICGNSSQEGFYVNGQIPPGETWMLARTAIREEIGTDEVVVGLRMDDEFARKMRDETGLEHLIWIGQVIVTTSFTNGSSIVPVDEEASNFTFVFGGRPYYATYLPLDENLKAAVALDVSEITATRNRLAGWMVTGILGVVALGSLLGVLLSRRISQPLVSLAESAQAFSRGDLDFPVAIYTSVREVSQVSIALENARIDLLSTMTSLQSERDWSEHLLASIVEGIVTLDGEGRITFFSHGAECITGWSRFEVLGRTCDEVFSLADSDELLSQVIPQPGKRAKADVRLAGEKTASLAITRAALVPTGAVEAEIALVFRDISEEEAVHRILGHFLANVSHEFRTPLSALAASIELLLDQAPDLSPTELQELLISLHLGTLGLQTLVDNLLESASIETGHFRISPRATDLGNIIAEAAETMRPLLEKYGQRLVIELPVDIPTVRADPRRTVQVLVNLIGNASKYGPPDAEIRLKVIRTPYESRVEVADQGPGISPEARDNLFRRFIYPAEGSNAPHPGAGLGLSVVKAIVEAHGGKVGVDDWEGSGVVFWFTLPVVEA